MVREAPIRTDWPGRLPAADTESVADLARRWRQAAILRPGGPTWSPADGRHHRRGTAAIPAAHRSLSRDREAARLLRGAAQGWRPHAGVRRGYHTGGG